VVSWLQGTFRLHEGLRTGQQVAVQDSASFDIFDSSTREFRASGLRNIRIEDLHNLVEAADCSNRKCVTPGIK
jgi:hypothetical protein